MNIQYAENAQHLSPTVEPPLTADDVLTMLELIAHTNIKMAEVHRGRFEDERADELFDEANSFLSFVEWYREGGHAAIEPIEETS